MKNTDMKNYYVILLSAALLSMSVVADGVPNAPTIKFVGCINGNMCVTLDKTGDPKCQVFQVKSLENPGSDWRTVKFTYKDKSIPMKDVYSYYRTMDFPGATLLRVAETNGVGTSDWSEAGPVTNYIRHAAAERIPGGNGYGNSLIDGVVGTVQEASNGKYQFNTNVWFGLTCNSTTPVGVSMIRYVPRQDSTGIGRMANAYFQCADDAAFLTNVVKIGTVASPLSLGRVYECVIDPPATSRYFRIVRYCSGSSAYLSVDDMELVADSLPGKISISVADSGDWTNHWPSVAWSVPAADLCNTGVLQRALSAAGPFSDVSGWTDATTGETFVDSNIVVGVTYYYRVKTQCVGGGVSYGKTFYSDVVRYVRQRRLDRSWDDLEHLNEGVSVMYPYAWIGPNKGGRDNSLAPSGYGDYYGGAWAAFDGLTNTYPEVKCWTNNTAIGEGIANSNRVVNAAIGLNLGKKYHVCGALVYPRWNNLSRASSMAIFGADEEAFTTRSQLSQKLGDFTSAVWRYKSTTNTVDQFQYVFLWGSNIKAETFGNVSEVGFFGYSDQDIVDSGLLIPPTTVSCETNSAGVVVSWDRGWNNASYRVERSRAGSEAWAPVASLETNVFSYVDTKVPRKGTWQWRVTSVSENSDTISSLPCTRYYDPHIGMTIIIF